MGLEIGAETQCITMTLVIYRHPEDCRMTPPVCSKALALCYDALVTIANLASLIAQ